MNKFTLWRVQYLLLVLWFLPLKGYSAVSICVFDFMGSQGENFALARDFVLDAKRDGIDIVLKPYMSEAIAFEDFKAKRCSGVFMTNLRARQLNKFVGSVDALGAVPSPEVLRAVIQLLMDPKNAKRMTNGEYEIGAIVPLGAVYPFVNDRSINSLAKAAGKRVAVFDWDKTQAKLVQSIGAQPVSADVITFGGKFNNGQVDIIASPALAFRPLELYKGLGTKGAIINNPFMQITAVLVLRQSKFPEGTGQKLRNIASKRVDTALALAKRLENDIPSQYWAKVPQAEIDGYAEMMRKARVGLTKDGEYDEEMMHFLKRVRCRYKPEDAECILDDE
jgi:hypothetical protein